MTDTTQVETICERCGRVVPVDPNADTSKGVLCDDCRSRIVKQGGGSRG